MFHEMPGLIAIGLFAAALFPVNQSLAKVVFLAFAVHLIEDWIIGKSSPFVPVDKICMQFFTLSFHRKVAIDVVLLLVSGALWITYLNGGL